MLYIASQQLNSNLVQLNGTFAMKTLFLLMARYEASPFLPINLVREDFFDGMSRKVFLGKVESGEIRLPLTRLDEGQKAIKGIAIQDLANFLDACSLAARKELARKRALPRSPLQFVSEGIDTEIGWERLFTSNWFQAIFSSISAECRNEIRKANQSSVAFTNTTSNTGRSSYSTTLATPLNYRLCWAAKRSAAEHFDHANKPLAD